MTSLKVTIYKIDGPVQQQKYSQLRPSKLSASVNQHHLLPEVFVADDSTSLAHSVNLAPLPKKKLPGKLAPIGGLGVNHLDDDTEKSFGSNMIERASNKIGGAKKHGQLAPMNFN